MLSQDIQMIEHLCSVYRDSKNIILRTRHIIKELIEVALLDCHFEGCSCYSFGAVWTEPRRASTCVLG